MNKDDYNYLDNLDDNRFFDCNDKYYYVEEILERFNLHLIPNLKDVINGIVYSAQWGIINAVAKRLSVEPSSIRKIIAYDNFNEIKPISAATFIRKLEIIDLKEKLRLANLKIKQLEQDNEAD